MIVGLVQGFYGVIVLCERKIDGSLYFTVRASGLGNGEAHGKE